MSVEYMYDFWKNILPGHLEFSEIESAYQKFAGCKLQEETQRMLAELQAEVNSEFMDALEDTVCDYSGIYEKVTFFEFYRPYLNHVFKLAIQDISERHFNKTQLNESILLSALSQLGTISGRVLLAEFSRKKYELEGETDKERAQKYNELLKTNSYKDEIINRYPEMHNLMWNKSILCGNFINECFKQTSKHAEEIKKFFKIDILKISSLQLGQGDVHNHGKSVSILTTETGCKIVYKPREMRNEAAFQRVIEWFNSKTSPAAGLDLKTIAVISGEGCGFAQHIDHAPCKTENEAKRFYYRCGELLALLYSLEATDMHYENLIANGEYPVIIDAETIISPHMPMHGDAELSLLQKSASIARIGMLPMFISKGDNKIDVSALNGGKEQRSPYKSHMIVKDSQSEEVKDHYDFHMIPAKENHPGTDFCTENHIEDIINGYRFAYSVISDNKEKFLLLINDLFGNIPIRVLITSTAIYSTMITIGYNPQLLKDRMSRSIALLRNCFLPNVYKNDDVFRCEYHSMLIGDIPYFTAKLNSKDLHCGKIVIKDYLKLPMQAQLIQKVNNMCQEDLSFQEMFIKEAFSQSKKAYSMDVTGLRPESINDSYLSTVKDILDYLIAKSFIFNQECRSWVDSIFDESTSSYSSLAHIGSELYNGEIGIALVMHYYGILSGDEKYLTYAEEIMKYCLTKLYSFDLNKPYQTGAFTGLSGSLYVLAKMYQNSNSKRKEYKGHILKYMELFNSIAEYDKTLDVIGGNAGLLHILCSIRDEINDADIKFQANIVIKKGLNTLLNGFDNKKKTWPLIIEGEARGYTGFAHGSAGIVSALARYASKAEQAEKKLIHRMINDYFRFEKGMLNDDGTNWYKNEKQAIVSSGWCHGSSGILLSKALLIKYGLPSALVNQDLATALKTTLNSGFGTNPSLCHGDLGNMDILLTVGKIINDNNLIQKSTNIFRWEYENVLTKRWRGKSFRGSEVLGLMLGLSGFAYGILRMTYPDTVQSVLFLE